MKCPKCGQDEDKVLDSRSVRDGATIRRRRECVGCGCRFTTHEEINRDEIMIVKRDGRREPFSRHKLEHGVRVACQKRPIPDSDVRTLLDEVIAELEGDEVPSEKIGELVMDRLHKMDEVAYIRFASVYRRFKDVNEFLSAITEMVNDQK
ncbi:MAG: transcriptional repressor NrdR [Kiritimatiellae bacterium]|jgi:transcriptional repressor NrdR|nr:transcriptional repressor NrdR [Kiritimatiellia bacterium]